MSNQMTGADFFRQHVQESLGKIHPSTLRLRTVEAFEQLQGKPDELGFVAKIVDANAWELPLHKMLAILDEETRRSRKAQATSTTK